MNKRIVQMTLAATLAALPVAGQTFDSGGLGAGVQKAMETALNQLQNQNLMTTEKGLAESIGQEKLDAFLDGAVVKLLLLPEGAYEAYSLEGGELVAFRLGKQKVEAGEEGDWQESWLKKSGDFELSKKPQKLSLTMEAGGNEVTVDCYNKYSTSETTVTYYVGPLDGLFCLGLADEQEEA